MFGRRVQIEVFEILRMCAPILIDFVAYVCESITLYCTQQPRNSALLPYLVSDLARGGHCYFLRKGARERVFSVLHINRMGPKSLPYDTYAVAHLIHSQLDNRGENKKRNRMLNLHDIHPPREYWYYNTTERGGLKNKIHEG